MNVRHDIHFVHEHPVTVPLSERAFKAQKLRQQQTILSSQMDCLAKMGTYPQLLSKLEAVQEAYMRVTDDKFAMSEEAQENAHNNVMREHELAALPTAPGIVLFRRLQPSTSDSTHGRSSGIHTSAPPSPTTL
jgi:hypothetical protein